MVHMTETGDQPGEGAAEASGAEARPWADAGPAAPPGVPTATPEPGFVARAPAPQPPPPPPLPVTRRAIFLDIENTTRTGHMARALDHLAIARLGPETELVAVGNWRVIGQETARLLAARGAQLVHSAPSTGVRDWSDLRIAVSAGVWLAGARPGDTLEIVSDDRAFDAVGDVAAALGIGFRRLSYRTLAGTAPEPAEAATRGEGRGRRGRRGRPDREAAPVPAATTPPGHTAPHDELVDVVRELIGGEADGSVNIDTLARALKARGYNRTPGSPRLITRLRRIKEVSVSPNGLVRLVAAPEEPKPEAAAGAPRGRRRPARRRRRRRVGAAGSGSGG